MSVSAAVCGSVRQCARLCVAVRVAVCGSVCLEVRAAACGCPAVHAAVCGCLAVRQCTTVRAAVCSSARSSVCATVVRVAVCGSACGSLRLFASARGSVRTSIGAAVCGSSVTRRAPYYIMYGLQMPDCPLLHHVAYNLVCLVCTCCGLPSPATRRSGLHHIRTVEARLPAPAPRLSQYISIHSTTSLPPPTSIYRMRAVDTTQPPPALPRLQYTFICCGLPSPAMVCGSTLGSV
jgi:hypothetical protein